MSSRQAGDHARESGVGRLVLTHIWPSLDHEISKAQAAEEYAGPIDSAVEGMKFGVGS
jgi:ribonuclease BN (tRNA processing enzyme)